MTAKNDETREATPLLPGQMIASSDKKMVENMVIREKNVPFKARILAAVPGKSLNKNIYTKELLQQSVPFYDGKPFILDHDIEHAERVVGIFSHPRYATERGMDDKMYEGLWLDGVGLMGEELFEKVKGTGLVPPLIRGFSIGGAGEGELQNNGILIKRFMPMEGSITAFPGIPAAHIAAINMVRESLLNHNPEVKKTEPEIVQKATANAAPVQVPAKGVALDLNETGKLAFKEIKEGPVPDQDTGAGTRQQNDVRPRLPTPGRGKPVQHQQPQATTSAETGHPAGSSTPTSPMEATIASAAEMDNPHQDDDEEEDEDKERLVQKSITVSTSTSRTDSELVIEPDENQEAAKLETHLPGEEEDKTENPILKIAGVNIEQTLGPPDVVPIQARAYSLPIDTGIYRMVLQMDKLRNPDRTQEAQQYIKAWNDAKKPPEVPMRKVRIKTGQTNESIMTPGTKSMIPTLQPTIAPRDDSVPTKSVTNIAPAPAPLSAIIRVSTLSATAAEVLEKIRKEPFGYWNPAGRAWRKMLPEMLEVR